MPRVDFTRFDRVTLASGITGIVTDKPEGDSLGRLRWKYDNAQPPKYVWFNNFEVIENLGHVDWAETVFGDDQ